MVNVWWTALAAGAVLTSLRPNKGRNLMQLPSFHGVVEVRASIPGRMRLFIPSIRERSEAARDMKEKMESTGAVKRVDLCDKTGSVLVVYDEQAVSAPVVLGAVIQLLGLKQILEKTPQSRAEKGMITLYNGLNHALLEATGGLLDIRMLAGGTLTVLGLRTLLLRGAVLPGAVTLLWWASNVLRKDD